MNIKDFLYDNYIYIIIVIILIIITIIGFLADKNKGDKKKVKTMGGTVTEEQKENVVVNQPQPVAAPAGPMNYQPVDNIDQPVAAPINPAPVAPMPEPVNQMPGSMPSFGEPAPAMNSVSVENTNVEPMVNTFQPEPVDNMNQNVTTEPAYQPLGDQTPTFTNNMQPVPNEQINPLNNFEMNQGMNQMAPAPEPLNPIPNMVQQPIPEPTPQAMPMPQPMEASYQQPTPQPAMQVNQMNQGPVNPAPIPNPQPNTGTIPNPITPPQPVQPQQINFVYGSGQNNNQMMQ